MVFNWRRNTYEKSSTVLMPDASISAGKTSPSDTQSGFWLGLYDGEPRFTLGDTSTSLSFDPTNGLVIVSPFETSSNNSVGSDQIMDGAVGTVKIAHGAVTANKVSVAQLSALTADLGTVTAGSLVVGSANKLWLNDSSDGSLAIGGTVKGTAPFKVNNLGTLTATDAQITGTINASSGEISGELAISSFSGKIVGYVGVDKSYTIHQSGIDYEVEEDPRRIRWVKSNGNAAASIGYGSSLDYSALEILAKPTYSNTHYGITLTASDEVGTIKTVVNFGVDTDPLIKFNTVSNLTTTPQIYDYTHVTQSTIGDGFGISMRFNAGSDELGRLIYEWSDISARLAQAKISVLGHDFISFTSGEAPNAHLKYKLAFFGVTPTKNLYNCSFGLTNAIERQEGNRNNITLVKLYDIVATVVSYLKAYGLFSDL